MRSLSLMRNVVVITVLSLFALTGWSRSPATSLVFSSVPATGTTTTTLSAITVTAAMANGNPDNSFTGAITLSKNTGSGTLAGTLTKAAVKGVVTFTDLQFSAAGTYTLKVSATSLPSTVSGSISISASLGSYVFSGTACSPTALAATNVAPNITFSQFSSNLISCGNSAANAYSGTISGGSEQGSNKYVQFTVSAASGYLLNASSLSFDVWASANGVANFSVRSSIDGFASDITTGSVATSQTSVTPVPLGAAFSNITSVTFRIYGYNGSGKSASDFMFDNVSFNGSVSKSVPTATVAGNASVCQNAASPVIAFTGSNGASPYTFTYSINNGANQTVVSSGNTATVSVPTTTAGSFVYKLISVRDNSSAVTSLTQNSLTATVTVYAPLDGANIKASGPTTICNGNVLLTSDNANAYQWYKDGTAINAATGKTYAASASGNYTVKVSNAGGCSATSSAITVNLTSANTWTAGAGSTDWFAKGNWCQNAVPTSTTDVVIPTGVAKYPALSADAAVKSIEIQKDALIVLNSKTISIYGNVSGTGIFTGSSASSIILNGTATSGVLYFDQATDSITNVIKDLVINTTGTFNIGNKLYLTHQLASNAGTLNTNGNLTLRSTSINATAQVAQVKGTISGDVTVERFITRRRAYRFLSPAVTTTTSLRANWMENVFNPNTYTNNNPKPGYGTHITSYAGPAAHFDQTVTNNPSIFTYNNAKQLWETLANTDGTLKAGYPYRIMVRGSRAVDLNNNTSDSSVTILRSTGKLLTGSVTFDKSSASPYPLSGGNNVFNFIGNPYASAVDWDQMVNRDVNPANGAQDISYTYTAWDPNINTRGAYITYNSTYGQTNNSLSKIDNNIQPGQAIFVQATGANPSITFMEKYKTATTRSIFRVASDLTKLSVQLLSDINGNTQTSLDGFLAVFDNKFSKSIGDEDSYKITNQDENMAINRNGTLLSIEGRPAINSNDTLPVKLWQYRQKNYTLQISPANFQPLLSAFLKDAYLKTETPVSLTSVTSVPFSITADSASFAPDRFIIIFKTSGVLPVTVTDVKAYSKDKGIAVEWTAETETNVQNYAVEKSADGITFASTELIAAKGNNSITQNYNWFDAHTLAGNNFYRVRISEISGAVKYTRIIKVYIGKGVSGMAVFPNPVTGNTIGLQLNNVDKGIFYTSLYNSLGQKMYSGTVNHSGGTGSYSVATGVQLSKGIYNLQVINGSKKMNTKVVVE